MRIVLLLHLGLSDFEVVDEVGIEELRAVVEVQVAQSEGQRLLDLLHPPLIGLATQVPHRTHFRASPEQ